MEWLINLDTAISLAINGAHSEFCDAIMIFVSKTAVWIPLYLAVLISIIVKFKFSWKVIIATAMCLIVTLVLTDQISSMIKDAVCRLRPCHEPSLDGIVRVIVSKGGKYGFVSSHAANVVGFALIVSALFQKKWVTFSIWAWASIISYSRIYLAKHYLGDVLGGIIIGVIISLLMMFIYKKIASRLISTSDEN